ncbi:unnamed protein product [Ceratitis capitata]|uniref:(Mediterranean fruit fly) hypothetical protein n=1 Tax=Ceratitis capitata TaxID=7213 RepID=A0A811VEQ6_CERCA|nr:unnamed protein product [Ceratitis capitata]
MLQTTSTSSLAPSPLPPPLLRHQHAKCSQELLKCPPTVADTSDVEGILIVQRVASYLTGYRRVCLGETILVHASFKPKQQVSRSPPSEASLLSQDIEAFNSVRTQSGIGRNITR